MKQGSGNSRYGDAKREPIPHRVDIASVGRLGIKVGTHVDGRDNGPNRTGPIHAGRGYKAPMNASQTGHKSGSQGRHK